MFGFDAGVVALLIPIIAVLGGMAIAVVGVLAKGKEEELKHKERILAMEKGIPIPQETKPVQKVKPRYLAFRAWGLVITLIGLALVLSISVAKGIEAGIWGLIPTALGVGLLLASVLEKRDVEGK
ncbi:MAG: DUF6249 domain-containing protein [Candidatus Krumholzibacteria bacterium]|nr:DUF6249 domain-containing protein [Candidatus Krumholzibacteria bacterium]